MFSWQHFYCPLGFTTIHWKRSIVSIHISMYVFQEQVQIIKSLTKILNKLNGKKYAWIKNTFLILYHLFCSLQDSFHVCHPSTCCFLFVILSLRKCPHSPSIIQCWEVAYLLSVFFLRIGHIPHTLSLSNILYFFQNKRHYRWVKITCHSPPLQIVL